MNTTKKHILGIAWACGSMAAVSALGQAANDLSATNVLSTVTVEGQLNQARSQILTSVGATSYAISAQQIANIAQGDNAPFQQVLLRVPGMAEDSLGQVHLRGEHANLQYRIDDVLLPEGITGFGNELDPRFVKDLQLITGSLPAEYGFRTAGIVDIQTKGSAITNGGSAELYGGSYDTIRPSFQYQGASGKWTYYVDGSYDHNNIGIEDPTPSSVPIHDYTDQYRTFLYGSYLIDASSRLVLMGSANYATFEIPISPNLTPNYPSNGPALPSLSPTALNDNQTEQNYYGVAAYQKSAGDFNGQFSVYGRASGAHYMPDDIPADLEFNSGVATDENRFLYSGGGQFDGSYQWGEHHTIRAGAAFLDEAVQADTYTTVIENFDTGAPFIGTVHQNEWTHAIFAGVYLQDEWKIVKPLTLNYGARFDVYSATSDDENQLSPRANLVYKPFDTTTLHIGYSRYFTPPPLETVPASDIAAFANTSAETSVSQASPVRAERANYYDAGISQKVPFVPGLTLGVDGYYKTAQNQLDDGFFGQSLILSSFNYDRGRVRGVEFTVNYEHGGFSSYANVAYSVAQGMGTASAQFLWPDQTTVNYVNGHWIYLDHDQRVTGSFGAAYVWNEGRRFATRVFVDALYGSGLRQDGDPISAGSAVPVPNGSSVGAYDSVAAGLEESFRLPGRSLLKVRVDVVNVGDAVYPLRTGSGVGVNAPQYGERRGIFGSISYIF
ncbi:MAG TPA: TonB-dependent receptor [Verrucomicrobiae bacterium]|jgi:outer membrane receptor protein involved in Fe transport